MTAMETLNPYLDINNYERAQDVVSHVRVLTHEKTYADGPAVTGACLLVRSDLFRAVDGFDENYEEECQDVHLCLAVSNQLSCVEEKRNHIVIVQGGGIIFGFFAGNSAACSEPHTAFTETAA